MSGKYKTMMSCSVFGCSRKPPEGGGMLRHFRFPKDESIRLKWIQRCGRRDKVSSYGRLCDRHFSPQQYARDLQSELLGIPAPRNKRLLKPEAIPDLHLPGMQGVGMPRVKKKHRELVRNADKLRKRLNESTEDMTSGMPEAECSPSSSSINMLSINNEENGVEENHECSLCNICNKVFKCNSHLKAHMDIHSEEKKYECDICCRRFVQNCHLKKHMASHSRVKKYECSVCHKRFTQQSRFKTHMNIHEEKRYECNMCNKKFAYKRYLASHMAVHTKEKKYECNVCGRRFPQRSSIKRHMVVHTREKNYECDICKKKFGLKQDVRQHMNIHIGERKYECTICVNRFTRNSSLEMHMLSHSKVKKYECHICNKKFNQKGNLKKHETIHENILTAKAIYQCHICDEKYELESVLKRHLLSHNKDVENETPFEYVEIPPFVKKETDDSCYSETSENIFDKMCDEREDWSCTMTSEIDIKTEEYFEDI